MKNLRIALGPALFCITTVFCRVAHAQTLAEYPDVPRDHWAAKAVNRISGIGILEGDPDGSFQGNRLLHRQEFSVALARYLTCRFYDGNAKPPGPFIFSLRTQKPLLPQDIKSTLPLPDVPPEHWAYDAVRAVYWTGLMEGDAQGRFQGDKPMTRYELAAAMERLFQVIRYGPAPKP